MGVKWIKIVTDIFDDEKILLIESLPDADSIIVIWFKLLCLAGKQNNSGVFMMSNKIACTDKMLATIFRRKETTVQLALKTFEEFGMIEIVDGVITIPNWGKHQSIEQIEARKEYSKKYQREYRAKQKQLAERNDLRKHLRKQNVNTPDKDIEGDKKENRENILLGAACADSKPEPSPVVSLMLNDKSFHHISQPQIDHWKELYPAVDVLQELRKMQGWLESNPKKRKTNRGISAFITAWLSKAQDKGTSVKSEQGHTQYDKFKTREWV